MMTIPRQRVKAKWIITLCGMLPARPLLIVHLLTAPKIAMFESWAIVVRRDWKPGIPKDETKAQ